MERFYNKNIQRFALSLAVLTVWMCTQIKITKGGKFLMTKNQIEYAKLLETRRANIVGESRERERLQFERQLGFRKQAETERFNRVDQSIKQASLDETARHQRQQETIEAAKLTETARHNTVGEQETVRAHLASEALTGQEQELRRTLETRRQSEVERHNLVGEGQTADQLVETHRANLQREYLEGLRASIERDKLTEAQRRNLEDEAIRWFNAWYNALDNPLSAGISYLLPDMLDKIKALNPDELKARIQSNSLQGIFDKGVASNVKGTKPISKQKQQAAASRRQKIEQVKATASGRFEASARRGFPLQ